ncbi:MULTISPECIES: Ni/Fe-hydrogenase, b-type cytochrome subunit [Sinorhizobium]|uniref:Probable Ni/Fe-hydrogenase B-type cytochrome subunit n=1 Tax=Sinorhizobium americanum TaxID=194963 RepID=A0A2S3YT13_9HYPH|nr:MULTISPECIES: Ni/Fe-hydrogenase, b-type cytochrome subunit [Sinorhizobium]PDT36625.1 Ni/Fe-hydrogenase, b-type cytochrome subunit [Sinorhizobium sp. FG01]PDT49948.1 Ni/Fe-hydrogenase, b-type cytochrome subunit [Sinorhizobium sp. NG07B]POH33551.1 Ni/Fe-hydrogenase, b-type cytochrome subunit [Sinorhizobium americanum]POH34768.1 Ni/Fe-hydrogenase, b-type cytochrome subunit [Sinorhizobium americanum]
MALHEKKEVGRLSVHVYDAPVRIWHWVNASSIMILALTGYLIASPLTSVSGEASANYLMGRIRFIHFAAAQILTVLLILRVYWVFVGGVHARQIFYIPIWSDRFWKEWSHEVRWYMFMAPQPRKYLGHNPLARFTMFLMFTMPLFFMVITGFALYSDGAGRDSWEYMLFGWVFSIWPNSQDIHTNHHLGMWVILIFAIVHIYVAVREDIMSSQSIISSMISGERLSKDMED